MYHMHWNVWKERKRAQNCTSMASTNYYTVKIHSYRFCVSYIDFSVSRVGPTRTAYSIFWAKKWRKRCENALLTDILVDKAYLVTFES